MRYKAYIIGEDFGPDWLVYYETEIAVPSRGGGVYTVDGSGHVINYRDDGFRPYPYCLDNMFKRKYPDKIRARNGYGMKVDCYKLDDGIFFDNNTEEFNDYTVYIPETHPLFNLSFFDLPHTIDNLVPDYTTAKIAGELWHSVSDPIMNKIGDTVQSS
jgi:hypothetical protein